MSKTRWSAMVAWFGLALALATSAHAGLQVAKACGTVGGAMGGPEASPVEAVSLLAWEIAPPAWAPEWAEVELRVLHDGVPVYEERLEARRDVAGEPMRVELMARSPRQRDLLVELARRDLAVIEAVVRTEGDEIRRPLLDLVADDSQAPWANLRYPQPAATGEEDDLRHVFAAGLDCSARNACIAVCDDEYWDCASVPCGPMDDCDDCEGIYSSCVANCPACVCTEPKSVTTELRTVYLGAAWSGSSCMNGFVGPERFDYLRHDYREDTVEITEACDGTKTERVLSSRYFSYWCWSRTWIPCSYAVGYPYPLC